MSDNQHDDKKPRRTRRPASLSGTLGDLRDQKRRALATRLERIGKLDVERRELIGQARALEDEIERLTLAIGDARDTERSDPAEAEAASLPINGAAE